jgi:hypothetical protein
LPEVGQQQINGGYNNQNVVQPPAVDVTDLVA